MYDQLQSFLLRAVLLSAFTALVFFGSLPARAQSVQAFSLQDVRLLNSPFKQAQQKDYDYIMALDPDRLLFPFLREAGLPTKAGSYPNWENTGLDGHIGGHYLTALSLMYAVTGDQQVHKRLVYMLDELKKCQEANGNGYIGGVPQSKQLWQEVAAGNIQADNFGLNKKWVPLYNIHKLYAGLRDAWLFAGNETAKDMLIKYADWMLQEVAGLTDAQVQTMLRSEHGGLNEVFADVAVITGDKKYLQLAKRFSHQALLQPLEEEKDILNGMHANTQIPKVIGFKRIADTSPADTAYNTAAKFFWNNVVNKRTSAIGGNSVREHFNPANDFSSMINDVQGPETCNTYNMLKLTKQFYLSDAGLGYLDYYERALYNHILSTENGERGGFVYFTPMRPGHYRVYSQPETSFWCCVGSGMENHAKYGELIYAHRADELYVNLFIPSQLTWKERGITLTQQNRFPEEEATTLLIEPQKTAEFTLSIRYPSWVSRGQLAVQVNGKAQPVASGPDSYVSIRRSWKKGDKVTVQLPMHNTTERMPDGSSYVAVLHGPIVLAAAIDTANMTGMWADASRGGHIPAGKLYPLEAMPRFVSAKQSVAADIEPVAGKPLHFRARNILYPERYKNIELVPFYQLHDTRYVIYWQQLTPDQVKVNEEKLKAQKQAEEKLSARTLDVVYAGEQQPESDHFVKSSGSATGINGDRHWRDARDWFSYQLTDREGQAGLLRVTYYGKDKDRHFFISVNGEQIADVQLDGSKGDAFYHVDYELPAPVLRKGAGKPLEVRFNAAEKSVAGGVYEIRLLRKETGATAQ
ncbi:MAG: glycoside hydrolase family 127 protein [Williamsia sp.]|nr:glycoside hydrolase family 127 protein [Williamsia sp.]